MIKYGVYYVEMGFFCNSLVGSSKFTILSNAAGSFETTDINCAFEYREEVNAFLGMDKTVEVRVKP